MRRFMVLSLALCLFCALINIASANPLLGKLGIESKRQLENCPIPVACFPFSNTCLQLALQGYNCSPRCYAPHLTIGYCVEDDN